MTVEEFVQMNPVSDETYELVDGELISLPSPTPLHGIIRDRSVQLIWNYFDRNPIGGAIGETDCRIASDTVRRPDLSIFLGEHWQQLDLKKVPAPFAPDIAMEVVSPSEHVVDVNRKVRDYLVAGSIEVWLLDPENGELHVRTKAGIRLLQGSDTLESPLLPGFSIAVATLLAGR
ncbi:MAG: Uma2 family endonuclease [Bryobacteraceae bacterium]